MVASEESGHQKKNDRAMETVVRCIVWMCEANKKKFYNIKIVQTNIYTNLGTEIWA